MIDISYLNSEEREAFWREAPPWVRLRMVSFLIKGFVLGVLAATIVALFVVL